MKTIFRLISWKPRIGFEGKETTVNGNEITGFVVKSSNVEGNGPIIVIHEWGNADIRMMTEKLAGEGTRVPVTERGIWLAGIYFFQSPVYRPRLTFHLSFQNNLV